MTNSKAEKKGIPYWKTIIYVLTAGWVVIWIYRTVLSPIYPQISAYFNGATDAQLGSISSFYFLGYVCMQIPSGILVDKLGKKKILLPGFLLFGFGTLIVSIAPSLSIVYLGSVLAGIGCGTYYGVAYSLTSENIPLSRKSLSTAIVNSGTAVGSGIGMISSSYLVGQHNLPWQYLMYAVIIFILIMFLIFKKYIKSEKKISTSKNRIIKTSSSLPAEKKGLFRPIMISAYILYFATLYAYYLIDTWLPNFLETERGFTGTSIGIASSLVFFTGIPGALIFSRFADKLPNKKVLIIIILELTAAAMLFLSVETTNKNILIFGLIAYGFFGKLAVEPIIISWLSEYAPKKNVATTFGVFNFFGMSSSIIVPSLTGVISDITGSKIYAFYLAISIILTGTLIFYIVNTVEKKRTFLDV